MFINSFFHSILKPAMIELEQLDPSIGSSSTLAMKLVLVTLITESQSLTRLKNGNKFGFSNLSQMDYESILRPHLQRGSKLAELDWPESAEALVYDLRLNVHLCWLAYVRYSINLPHFSNSLHKAYKKCYTGVTGSGSADTFLEYQAEVEELFNTL